MLARWPSRLSRMDADLQFVLDEAGMEVRYQYGVGLVHTTLRRFQAAADDRAGMRTLAAADFGIPADTPAGRAQETMKALITENMAADLDDCTWRTWPSVTWT